MLKSNTLFILSLMISVMVPAVALAASTQKEALDAYVEIQQSLARDSIEGLKGSAQAVAKVSTSKEVKTAAKKLAQSKDLADARKLFKPLSDALIKQLDKQKDPAFEVMYCSMVGAKWIQKAGAPVENPYYGKEMLSCGEAVK